MKNAKNHVENVFPNLNVFPVKTKSTEKNPLVVNVYPDFTKMKIQIVNSVVYQIAKNVQMMENARNV